MIQSMLQDYKEVEKVHFRTRFFDINSSDRVGGSQCGRTLSVRHIVSIDGSCEC